MNSNKEWEGLLTETRLTHLKRSVLECFINGDSLVKDAEVLFKNQRAHRAASLAILGIEELGKSYFLKCILDEHEKGTWNAQNYKQLLNHKFKQEFAFDACGVSHEINKLWFGGQGELSKIVSLLEETRRYLGSKGVLDIERQDMQFVTVNKDCTCKVPAQISKDRCEDVLKAAKIILSRIRIFVLTSEFLFDCDNLQLNLSVDIQLLLPCNDDYFGIEDAIELKPRRGQQ